MFKLILSSVIFLFSCLLSHAQPQTREELEKQRAQLKKEIEQTEKLLSSNKMQTKENLLQYKLITNKVNLQDRVIDNINRDLHLLENNMYTIAKDVKRYDRLLDTLKQEYAKSMVYAYKNRSSYDFLNFIFSAENFNDAIKRISYLKSYRSYREMQGENILRTQELRKKRIQDLGGARLQKNAVLEVQSKEMKTLEIQQKEKDRILAELKKQGKQLNNQIVAKQKQMQKVNNVITAAIKKAQKEAIEEAARLAKNTAAEKEKLRREAERAAKASGTEPETVKPKAERKSVPAPKKQESVLLNDDNIALNASFERNRGSLPWPLDRGIVVMHFGTNFLPSGNKFEVACVTISADIGTPVKAVFEGTVKLVQPVEDMFVVMVQHGRYLTIYSNISATSVQKGQEVKTGQVLGKVAANFEGVGALDFYLRTETNDIDPEKWLRRR
ncbi:MAG: peptidoglycan DD-metalloendopeptidase family protein [Sphingobacteriales bacterium]|jgi:septal ring factor EnvC (AmiA/AmiB activator)|nr:peptidoglycan DD-metalloendopeptidase family protein [Sphingobacteriales bacterium]